MNDKPKHKTLRAYEREVKDVISELLNDVQRPVSIRTKHVHVFRKEYRTCLIKGCLMTPSGRADDPRFS